MQRKKENNRMEKEKERILKNRKAMIECKIHNEKGLKTKVESKMTIVRKQ